MYLRLAGRVAHVARVLRDEAGRHGLRLGDVSLAEYRAYSQLDGYYKLRALIGDCSIHIAELILDGKVVKYSYSLVCSGSPLLRYDNAPHHPDLGTYPHHKHVAGQVLPLYDSPVAAFIREAFGLLRGRG